MSAPIRLLVAATLALAVLADGGVAAAAQPFKVTSTLAGKTVLPHRIRWVASASLPQAQIKQVEFLIDGGKPLSVEREVPYTFGEDENGLHQNYLVTSWLTPGRHRFTVRATAKDGRKSEHTVRARVLPAPQPPAALAGSWQRTIADTSGAPAAGSAGNPTETFTPPGTYTMVIEKRWIQVRFPGRFQVPQSDDTGAGWILDSDYTASATSLRAYGAVTFDTFREQAEWGWWCWQDGPPSSYRWSVSGSTLTLTPSAGSDACAVRGFVWAGEWTRAG